MSKFLKVLAIVMLVITIAGALAVLYGVNTLTPKVIQVTAQATPAASAQETFDAMMEQYAAGLLGGKAYGDVLGLSAEDCAFVTYTVRLQNKGFFPAEWIALQVQPTALGDKQDMLVLDNGGANVLPAGGQGDLAVTLLTTITEEQPPRLIEVSCYVFGRKQVVRVQAQ